MHKQRIGLPRAGRKGCVLIDVFPGNIGGKGLHSHVGKPYGLIIKLMRKFSQIYYKNFRNVFTSFCF